MKLNIDFKEKTIEIDGKYNLLELTQTLDEFVVNYDEWAIVCKEIVKIKEVEGKPFVLGNLPYERKYGDDY